ncbi:MAG: hypothetical protein R3D67_02320 [Hyphomicrobiaceae bacterium]
MGTNTSGTPFRLADLVTFGNSTAISSIITTLNVVNTSSLAQSSAFTGSPSNPKPNQQGGGIWVREVGGSVEGKASSDANVSASN